MKTWNTDPLARMFVRRTQAYALMFGALAGAVMGAVWSREAALGFVCGAAISVVNFQLQYADVLRIAGKDSKTAGRFITGRFFLRYMIMFGYLGVIALKTDLNVLLSCVGLLTVQAVLFIDTVFRLHLLSRR
jgi:hypothetical protein